MAPGHPGQGPMMSGGPTLQQVTIGGGGGQQAGMGGPGAPQQQGQPGKRPGLESDQNSALTQPDAVFIQQPDLDIVITFTCAHHVLTRLRLNC